MYIRYKRKDKIQKEIIHKKINERKQLMQIKDKYQKKQDRHQECMCILEICQR